MHDGIHSQEADTPGSRHPWRRHPPGKQTPPRVDTPQEADPPWEADTPCTVHAGRYGQQAGAMHPTEMHTCFRHVKASFTLILNVIIFRSGTFVLFYGHFDGQNGSANPFFL